ncbi:uncharacterized protein DMENIID0001_021050 [Sergentomyia squamirostris]
MSSNKTSDQVVWKCPDFVMKACGEIAAKHEIYRPRYIFQRGSEEGDGFNGVVMRVVIVDEVRKTELSLICKRFKRDPHDTDNFIFKNMFHRKIFTYCHVLPEFVALQQERNIQEDEGFFSFPTCHFAQQNVDEAALIFEDLCASGYRMMPKRQCPDFDHAQLLMIQLGRLHALFFALRKHRPHILQRFQGLDDICTKFMRRKVMKPIVTRNCRLVQAVLRPEETMLSEKAEPWAVINHGDCWTNNLMYSYDKNHPGNPAKITLIDWQTCQYGSPVLDIYYFLFISTNKSFRDVHYRACLDIYYESLSKLLKQLDDDVDYVLEHDEQTLIHRNKQRYEERMRGNLVDFVNFELMH